MDIWVVLGVIGSVASIVGLLVPLQSRYQRVVHVAYSAALALISATAVWYWAQANRVKSVERQATNLVANFSSDYTSEGFVLAALAFLEKNRDLYPDAYARVHSMCPKNECLRDKENIVQLSFALQGLLKGIGVLEGGA